jgi:hypothetical protein
MFFGDRYATLLLVADLGFDRCLAHRVVGDGHKPKATSFNAFVAWARNTSLSKVPC